MLCHLPQQMSPSPQSDTSSDQAPQHGLTSTLALTNCTGFARAVLFPISWLIKSSFFFLYVNEIQMFQAHMCTKSQTGP